MMSGKIRSNRSTVIEMGTDEKENLPIYTMTRGKIGKESNVEEYGVVLFRTVMRTNYPITLVGLSFFGPAERPATYVVEYEVSMACKPDYYFLGIFKRQNVPDPVLCRGRATVKAVPGEIFRVDLERVSIPANTGIEIAFCLDGPKTRRMESSDTTVAVQTKKRVVRFELSKGSYQMPEVFFCMEEDKE